MQQRELAVTKRSEAGTSAARHLRRQGLVPATLYGRGSEPVALAVSAKRLRELMHEGGHNLILRLNIEDGAGDVPTVMLREVQVHPLSGAFLNADFQRISLSERITASVPVVLVGEAPGIKRGGLLDQVLHEVEVEALPTELPAHLELNVSELQIGQSLHASDLAAPAGARIVADPSAVIVSMTVPRVVEEAVPAVAAAPEEAEAEEKPEAEAAAGAPAAAGGQKAAAAEREAADAPKPPGRRREG